MVAHLKLEGDKAPLIRTTVHSKLDCWCVVYVAASIANLRQLEIIYSTGLKLKLAWRLEHSAQHSLQHNPPLEERQLKLSMHYHLKTRAHTDNPAHHALHQFDPTTKYICFFPGQKRQDLIPDPTRLSHCSGNHGLCRDQWCIGLPLEGTKLSA